MNENTAQTAALANEGKLDRHDGKPADVAGEPRPAQIPVEGNGSAEAETIVFPASFSEEQRKALTALFFGATIAAAARAAGVHRMTVSRWLDESEFRHTLRVAQGQKMDRASRDAMSLAGDAAALVGDAIRAGDVRAALAVLKALGILRPISQKNIPQ